MPSIKVMVWNIQNFGSDGVASNYKGENYELLAQFIADVVRVHAIDVLAVMEVGESGEAALDNVMFALNQGRNPKDWCYDRVAGSIRDPIDQTAPGNINSSDDLSWASSSVSRRSEGYAVFWQNSETARFKMLRATQDMSEGTSWQTGYAPAYRPTHAVSLSLKGRRYDTVRPPPYVQTYTGFQSASPALNWVDSRYPDVSKYVSPYLPRWEKVRRPAYFVLEVQSGGGQANQICPVQVYHAPSADMVARPGIYLAGLAQEHYAMKSVAGNQPTGALMYHNKTIAAGDYNLDVKVDGNWDSSYRTFLRPFGANFDTGADCTPLYHQYRFLRTTVQINEYVHGAPTGNPIEEDDIDDYYHSSIDNLFYRQLPNVSTYLATLPVDVMNQGALTGASLTRWRNHLAALVRVSNNRGWGVDVNHGPLKYIRKDGVWGNFPIFPRMTNWSLFYRGIREGSFYGDHDTDTGGARSAAEFIHDFVSDHLPVVVKFDV